MTENLPAEQSSSEKDRSLNDSTPLDVTPSSGVNILMQQLNIFNNEGISPDNLAELEKLHPGFAHQFLANVLSETPHRQKMESRGQLFDFLSHITGQVAAVVVVCALVGFGVYAIYEKSPIGSIATCFTIIGLMVTTIILGKKQDKGEAAKPDEKELSRGNKQTKKRR